MPTGPQGEKRPADVTSNAVHVMRIATGEIEEGAPADDGKDLAAKALGARGGARRLTEGMIEKAARRGGPPDGLLYLGGVAGEDATDNRVAGFRDALRAGGIEPGPRDLDLCGYPPESSRDALRSAFDSRGRLPSGLFLNWIAAFEGAAETASSSLPETDLGSFLARCFDWDPFAACLPFDVAMLRQDVEAMTRHAFDALAPASREGRQATLVPAVTAEGRHRAPPGTATSRPTTPAAALTS